MRELFIDIETYSGTDLGKSGVYRYSEAPDFEVLLFGYSADGAKYMLLIWLREKLYRLKF
jgi:DNA polymerase